jgi:GLPGLI family protein
MNKLLYLILFFLLDSSNVIAQFVPDSVMLRIHYISKMKRMEDSKKLSDNENILDIGKHSSHFYSLWAERNRDIRDSVLAHGGGLPEYQSTLAKSGYPSSISFNVFKNYPQKGKLTYTDSDLADFIYEEDMVMPQWEMLNGDSIIAEYPCKKAKTTFRGRTWIVWYTMDIAYSDGPWKLYGLPGVILKAIDSKGDFIFYCIEIKRGTQQAITLRKLKYIKCTPKELEENQRLSAKDLNLYLEKFGFGKDISFDRNGKPMVRKPRVPCLLEYRINDKK